MGMKVFHLARRLRAFQVEVHKTKVMASDGEQRRSFVYFVKDGAFVALGARMDTELTHAEVERIVRLLKLPPDSIS